MAKRIIGCPPISFLLQITTAAVATIAMQGDSQQQAVVHSLAVETAPSTPVRQCHVARIATGEVYNCRTSPPIDLAP
ncbi:hypothetical protein [Filimonas effusa]|uniref:Secreted protein n=1 Tax=Filimonas effusa TaxID=2508721 RepID=A0A4Q1D0K6_9BACT|nr:hypothetical protein [Filimonas effusa]RXK81274.1 hypothetical protein ESB13_20270 [Filimonas effusa]